MPTKQEWLIEKRLVQVHFIGELSIHDIVEALETSAHFVDAGDPPSVHFLHDWTQLDKFPTNILQIMRSVNVRLAHPDRVGWMVAYGSDNRLMRYVSQTVLQIMRIKFRTFSTREDALAYLCHMDATLPQIPPVPDRV